jgi:hypothetical protein
MSQQPADSPRPRSPFEPAAILTLLLLSAVWAWWAWQKGAYFGTVVLPGTIVLCLVLALLAGFAPWRAKLSLSGPAALALGALVALGIWTLLSALWSPAPDIAIADGQRVLVYAIAFGLGMWLCNLLGSRMGLSLLPLAAAGAFAGVATIVVLLTGDDPSELLELDGTLDYPLGYRNANAAFFAIALFPALGIAADRELDWRLRGLALGAATLCLDLFLLSQSRGSLIALLAAVVVYLLASPLRLRALCWLLLAALPAIGIVPALTELYDAANADGVDSVVGEMQTAGIAAAITAVAGAVLGALAARFSHRLPGLGSSSGAANRTIAGGIALAAVLGLIGFVVAVGNPVDWVGDRADEFRSAGSPDLSEESSRYSLNAGSDRYDLWRVALDDFAEDPLFGDGAGGFQYTYLEKREVTSQSARDAHSVEFEVLAELGLPGLLLLVCVIVGATVGIIRARRLGPSAAGLGAIALASGTYWLVHSSIDWFWPYPALVAPTMALLGSACAPAILDLTPRPRIGWRPWLIAGLILLAVSAVPPLLSERYVNDAYEGFRSDPERAYGDLDRAQTLNPLSDVPLLAEAVIARESGDPERAVAALREAIAERPEEWGAHYLLAELLRDSDPEVARNEARVALELNPLSGRVRGLVRELGLGSEIPPAPES